MCHIVPGKCPWALAAQAPNFEGGRLHGEHVSEEKELSLFLIDTAKAGYEKIRKEVKGLVEKVAQDKGVLKKSKVTDVWFRRFLERQPTLSL